MKNSKGKMLVASLMAIVLAFLCAFGVAKVARAAWHAPSSGSISPNPSNGANRHNSVSTSGYTTVGSSDKYAKFTTNLGFYDSTTSTGSPWLSVTVGSGSGSLGFETGSLYINTSAGSTSNKFLSSCSGNKSSYKSMYIRFKFYYGSSSYVSCSTSSQYVDYYISKADTATYMDYWFTYEAGFDWYDNDYKFTFQLKDIEGPVVGYSSSPSTSTASKTKSITFTVTDVKLPSSGSAKLHIWMATKSLQGVNWETASGEYQVCTLSGNSNSQSCTMTFGQSGMNGSYYINASVSDASGNAIPDSAVSRLYISCISTSTHCYSTSQINGIWVRWLTTATFDWTSPSISGGVYSNNKYWYKSSSTVVSFSDSISFGYYKIGSSGSAVYSSSVTLTSSNCGSSCTIYAYDTAGNSTYRTFYLDSATPVINGGYYRNSYYWIRSSQNISFSDSSSGFSYYKIGSGSAVYSSSVTLNSSNCSSSCTVYAYDNVGNYTSRTFKRDSYQPYFGCYNNYLDDDCDIWNSTKSELTFYYNDSDSGIGSYPTISVFMFDHIPADGTTFHESDLESQFIQYWDLDDSTYYYLNMDFFDGWYTGPVYIMIEVSRYSYEYDEDVISLYDNVYNYVTYDHYITILDDDDHYSYNINYIYFDTYYDNIQPSVSGATYNNGKYWYTAGATTLTASDDHAGIWYYQINDGSRVYNNSVALTAANCGDSCTVKFVDGASNVTTMTVYNIALDTTAPTVSATPAASVLGTRFNGTITVTFADETGGSGVWCYTTTSTSCSSKTGTSVTISSTTTIYWRDLAGNYNHITYITGADSIPAPSGGFINGSRDEFSTSDQTISIYVGEGAVLADTPYCFTTNASECDTEWVSSNVKMYSDDEDGVWYAYIRDPLGNVRPAGAFYIRIDKTAPLVTGATRFTTWTDEDRTIVISASDSHTAVAAYYCNGSWQTSNECVYTTTLKYDYIKVRDTLGNETTGAYAFANNRINVYVDKTVPTITITASEREISNDIQYLTEIPTVSAIDRDSGINDKISKVTVFRCSFVLTIETESGCVDVSTAENPYVSGYLYWIHATDKAGNTTTQGDGAKMFYLLLVDSAKSSESTILSFFKDHTTVTTLDNTAPAITFDDTLATNFFKLFDNAFDYMRIVAYDSDNELSDTEFNNMAVTVGLDELVELSYDKGRVLVIPHTLSTAKGQTGARKIAYQFCTDEGCTKTSVIDSTSQVTLVSAEEENAANRVAVVTPVLAIASRSVSNTSKWVAMISLVIVVMITIEAIFVAKLLAKKKSN